MSRRPYPVPEALTLEGEAAEYGPMSVEQRGALLVAACRAAGAILRARADAHVALDYVDPLPESTRRALAWLRVQRKLEHEIAVYDEVVAKFGGAPELALREQVAKALVSKGGALGQLGRFADAIAVYDEVAAQFGGAPERALREQVAKALVNKGVALGRADMAASAAKRRA